MDPAELNRRVPPGTDAAIKRAEMLADAASCRKVAADLAAQRCWCSSSAARAVLERCVLWNTETAERLEREAG